MPLDLNNGLTVYHAKAGKRIIGTARPGNNSGFLMFKGSETEIGIIVIAKEMIENEKLKTISPLFFNQLTSAQYIKDAITQMAIFRLKIVTGCKILEKSVSVAKK